MDVKKIGVRLREIREVLGYSQVQIAEILESNQNIVSRIERGYGATTKTFLKLFAFYSRQVYIDLLFADDNQFKVIKKDDIDNNGIVSSSPMLNNMKNAFINKGYQIIYENLDDVKDRLITSNKIILETIKEIDSIEFVAKLKD